MKLINTIIFSFLLVISFAQSKNYNRSIIEFREAYKIKFDSDQRAPLKGSELDLLEFFKPRAKFRMECKVSLTPDSKPFEMPTYSGITKPYKKYADLHFTYKGQEYTLSAYQNLNSLKLPMYKNHLFVPYKDETNDESTYGGGRYINLETTDIEENKVILDFNKSYNPWCAYSDGFNCPIPPRENHLHLKVKAGEKQFPGPKKKAKH